MPPTKGLILPNYKNLDLLAVCKPKILPLKSAVVEKMERVARELASSVDAAVAESSKTAAA